MPANKCCCCGLLSCFSDIRYAQSAQPDSSEIAPFPPTVIVNPSSAAATSSSAPLKASDDNLGPDFQPSSPSAPASTQANASTDGAVMQNDSQPIAPSPVPRSCSQGTATSSAFPTSSQTTVSPTAQPARDKGFEGASSSTPSFTSLPKESDHAKCIMEGAKVVDKENVDVDLSDLINYISELLRFIEEKKKGNNPSMLKAAKDYWPGSKTLKFLSDGITEIKDNCADSKRIDQDFLRSMGAAHMATTGLLAVANILERYETISINKEACLSLLKEMSKLAIHVQQLQKRPTLKEGMEASMREAIALIVEASMACCTQIDRSKFSR